MKLIPTPHINCNDESLIAKTVLMPGDPLRAKFLAEKYLDNYICFTTVRNILGYTGYYKGKRISVMASGMGMPSIGIYSYELYKFYNVENIIRIGSAGSYKENINIYDIVLAKASYSNSLFAFDAFGYKDKIMYPSEELNNKIIDIASKLNIKINYDVIHSSDAFYHENNDYLNEVKKYDCACVEMESFALFANAKALNKKAACLLTISDSLVKNEFTTSEEREKSFTKMMEIALEL